MAWSGIRRPGLLCYLSKFTRRFRGLIRKTRVLITSALASIDAADKGSRLGCETNASQYWPRLTHLSAPRDRPLPPSISSPLGD